MALGFARQVLWFTLAAGDLVARDPGADGVFRSQVFPGLWLAPEALWAGDLSELLARPAWPARRTPPSSPESWHDAPRCPDSSLRTRPEVRYDILVNRDKSALMGRRQ